MLTLRIFEKTKVLQKTEDEISWLKLHVSRKNVIWQAKVSICSKKSNNTVAYVESFAHSIIMH